ncbi:MAG: hypothetical protein HY721_01640 [Planctomycetes bacterium]|nr:hypothetical protein [Planctomycetota bacterium]
MPLCPNCSAPLDAAQAACGRCGYRPDLGWEYLWLYSGGIAFVVLGFALGALGVLAEGAGPEHWSRACAGWFPLVPWPSSHHWLAFLVAGISLTLCGLGVTRRRLDALLGLLLVLSWVTAGSVLAACGLAGSGGARSAALGVLAVEVPLLLLALRVALAFRRTPRRPNSTPPELGGRSPELRDRQPAPGGRESGAP